MNHNEGSLTITATRNYCDDIGRILDKKEELTHRIMMDSTTDEVIGAMAMMAVNLGHNWMRVIEAMRDVADEMESMVKPEAPFTGFDQ